MRITIGGLYIAVAAAFQSPNVGMLFSKGTTRSQHVHRLSVTGLNMEHEDEFDYDAAIERALEAQEKAAAAAKAAEIAAAWSRIRKGAAKFELAEREIDLGDEERTATVEDLKLALASKLDNLEMSYRAEAAKVLLINRDILVGDAIAATTSKLRRNLDGDDGPIADSAIREAARRLLDIPEAADGSDDYADTPGDAAIVARAAKFMARRICSPQHLSEQGALALRCALLSLASEAEKYAWTASGGLL